MLLVPFYIAFSEHGGAAHEAEGELNVQGHKRAVGLPGIKEYTGAESYWVCLKERRQLTQNKPGWRDEGMAAVNDASLLHLVSY